MLTRCVRDTNRGTVISRRKSRKKDIEDLTRECVVNTLEKIETVLTEATTERMETGAAPDMNFLGFDFWNVIPLT